jgi:hypothetical protein
MMKEFFDLLDTNLVAFMGTLLVMWTLVITFYAFMLKRWASKESK